MVRKFWQNNKQKKKCKNLKGVKNNKKFQKIPKQFWRYTRKISRKYPVKKMKE